MQFDFGKACANLLICLNTNLEMMCLRVGNERARSSSGENERKDFRAKSSSGENERKDFRAEPSSGERIFERVRVRAMLEHVSSEIRASSLTNFGQIRACFDLTCFVPNSTI